MFNFLETLDHYWAQTVTRMENVRYRPIKQQLTVLMDSWRSGIRNLHFLQIQSPPSSHNELKLSHSMASTPTKSLADFAQSLSRFSYSPEMPLRRSARLSSPSTRIANMPSSTGYISDSAVSERITLKRKIQDNKREEKTPTKKVTVKKSKRGYASPEQYAHLSGLTDHLASNLDSVYRQYHAS